MQQIDSKDCSLIVLNWFHNHYYKKFVSLNKLKANVVYSDTGINIKQLQSLSFDLNIKLQSFSCAFNMLKKLDKKELPFGALITVNDLQHMVIIKKNLPNKIVYFDPIYGLKTISNAEFEKIYLGVLFKFTKIFTNKKSISESKSINVYFYFPYLLILLISLINKIATPFVTKVLIGNVYFTHSFQDILSILIIFIWMQISSQLFYVLSYKTVNKVIIKSVFNNNAYLLKIIKNNPDNTLFKYTDSETINRFNAIKETIEFKYTFWSDLLVDTLTIFISFIFLYYSNNLILLVCIIYSFLSLFISIFVSKKTKIYFSILKEKTAIYNNNIFGTLNYLRTNNNQNYYKFLKTKTKNSLMNLHTENFKNSSFLNFWNSIIEWLTNIIPFIVYVIAIVSFWNSGKQIQEFIFYLTGISLITIPIKSINGKIISWKNNEHNTFLLETFNFYIKKDFPIKTKISQKENYSIEIKDLVFKIKGKKIIDIPKMTISKNSYISGINGAGKSTLLKLFVGIYQNYSGTISLVNDKLFHNLKQNSFEFGFVPSDEFFPNLPLIQYFMNNDEKIKEIFEQNFIKYDLKYAFEIMNLNLETHLLNNASNLSTGQKKFISLIKLLTIDTKIVFLDEAFENLNSNVSQFLKECIRDKFKDSLFIEVSHTNNFVCQNHEEINIEKINKE